MDVWSRIGRGNRQLFSSMLRGLSNPCEGAKIPTFLFEARVVCSPFLHLRSSWRHSLDTRNGSRVGATKAVKRGRRSPDRQTLAAKEVRLRRLQLFPKQVSPRRWVDEVAGML